MQRLLLKLSGEALAGKTGVGVDPSELTRMALEIRDFTRSGGQLGVVLGGGNLFRGHELQAAGMDRVTADHIGLLATVMNGLAFRDLLDQQGVAAELFSAFAISGITNGYSRNAAVAALEAGAVGIFVGGTGNPLFTTDSAACLRGIDIGADAVLKATKVDGVYSADPMTDPTAVRYDELTYTEVLDRALGVMDLTAICLCRDHDMPVVVFDMRAKGALTALVNGDKVGTRIHAG